MKKTTFLLILLSFFLSCKEKTEKTEKTVDPVVYAESNDRELEDAKNQALSRLDYFINSFKKKNNDSTYIFSIKIDFIENDQHEHMWITIDRIENNKFFGVLDNDPETIKNYKLGDRITVKKEQIEDWAIMTNNEMEGGYSVKVLQKRQN